ncbi:hypothetical protein [Streptomyces sp. DSM 40907]|uniref:hypothetical protein n=1 Tax=Streptomyces kutzneri TaxID=3051179 RepID=UPI0028D338DD|nr:hypothetical protein [Streptomyces sp. DSM 40907]
MSEAAQKARRVFTGVESSGPVPIEYRFSHAKNGNRHLIVVFANHDVPGEYGGSNGPIHDLRANVLWVRDLFDGENSHYLCNGMDFALDESVAGLISRVMNALSLTPDDCTVFGTSKGAGAALYFGLKYGFKNIVASMPRFLTGMYVGQDVPGAARVTPGERAEPNIRTLDSVLPEVVRGGVGRPANVYLVSSPRDEHYARQVEPLLGLFQGYENFNFVYNDSPLVAPHGRVPLRNLPAVMGLLNLLVDGITPRIGMVRTGYEQPDRNTSVIDAYLADTSQVKGDSFPRPVVVAPAANAQMPRNAIRFVGTAPVGAVRVSVWEDGKYQGAAPVAADGSWTWQREKPWARGRHVVRLFAADANNYHSKRTEVIFTALEESAAHEPAPVQAPASGPARMPAPAQPVALTVTAPSPQQQIPGPSVALMGYAPGAVRVEFRKDGVGLGATAVMADGSWSWDPGWAWPEGPHFVEAVAVDVMGNAAAWTTAAFTVVNTYTVPAQGAYFNARY